MGNPIEITVAAVTCRDDQFLVVEERSSGRLVFNQPAGHLEPGETLLEAVARETLEETAREFEPSSLLGIYLWRHPVSRVTVLRFAFLGTAGSRIDGRQLDEGIVATHWLTRDELAQRQVRLRTPMVLQCVDDCLAGTSYPLSILSHWDLYELPQRLALP